MLGKLLSLLFRTRFSKGYLILLLFIAFLDIGSGLAGTASITSKSISPVTSTVELGYLSFFLLLFVVLSTVTGGGIPFTKPDQDILLLLPIPKRILAFSVIIVQFVSVGLLFFVLSLTEVIGLRTNSLDMIIIGLDSFGLGMVTTTIPLATYKSGIGIRLPVAVLFSIFVLVSYLNFPYSLLAAYNGHYVYGSLLILAVLIVSVYFSVKNIVEGIEVRPRLGRFQSSSSYRVSIHNFGRTPNLAVFSFNFKMISLGGQATGPVRSGRTSFSTRIQLKTALFIMVIMALIFGILDYLTSPQAGNSFIQGGLGSLALFYLVLFPISFFFSSTLLLERIWISSLAMPANTYFSLVIASKMVQAVILNIPFVAVSIVLSLVLHNLVIGYFITFLVLSPLYAASLIVFSTFTRPIQITDTLSPQGRVGARNFLLVVPTLVFIFGYFIAIIFPIYALAPAILLGAVVAYSIFSKGFWERIVNKLVERGYV